MAEKSNSSVYIGNLDERVTERMLYDILIQAGRVVDLHVPRDKDNGKPKGFAFAEYESEDVAEYAVKLFSGLVILYKRTLKFAISGQDKTSTLAPAVNSFIRPRPRPVPYENTDFSPQPYRYRDSEANREQVTVPSEISMHRHNRYRSYHESTDYNNSRRVLGAALDSLGRPRSERHDLRSSTNYHPYY